MSVIFEKEPLIVPFTYTDHTGKEYFGDITEVPNPSVYEVMFEGETLEYFSTLEEAQDFVQNHIHEYVKEN